jgi:GNAT superfamily N-acetyltransferase
MSKIRFTDRIPNPRQYLELFETTGWNRAYKLNASEISILLERSWYIVSAYHEQQLIAIGRLVSDGVLYAMIYDMIVNPSFQNRGIGTIILEKLVGRCKARGIRDIQLFSASGKSSFYAKRGFIERPANAPGMRYSGN